MPVTPSGCRIPADDEKPPFTLIGTSTQNKVITGVLEGQKQSMGLHVCTELDGGGNLCHRVAAPGLGARNAQRDLLTGSGQRLARMGAEIRRLAFVIRPFQYNDAMALRVIARFPVFPVARIAITMPS
jgi:hypothetical protein